jgi:hypothetical protein
MDFIIKILAFYGVYKVIIDLTEDKNCDYDARCDDESFKDEDFYHE